MYSFLSLLVFVMTFLDFFSILIRDHHVILFLIPVFSFMVTVLLCNINFEEMIVYFKQANTDKTQNSYNPPSFICIDLVNVFRGRL